MLFTIYLTLLSAALFVAISSYKLFLGRSLNFASKVKIIIYLLGIWFLLLPLLVWSNASVLLPLCSPYFTLPVHFSYFNMCFGLYSALVLQQLLALAQNDFRLAEGANARLYQQIVFGSVVFIVLLAVVLFFLPIIYTVGTDETPPGSEFWTRERVKMGVQAGCESICTAMGACFGPSAAAGSAILATPACNYVAENLTHPELPSELRIAVKGSSIPDAGLDSPTHKGLTDPN